MIILIKSQRMFIDEADWLRVQHYRWTLGAGRDRQKYVIARSGREVIYLHRLLVNAKPSEIVDHVNRNKLDNRRSNLRIVSHLESVINRGLSKNNTSTVKGVSWHTARGSWRAHIMVNRKQIHLGLFTEFDEAVAARRAAEQKYFAAALPPGLQEEGIAA